MLRVSRQEGSGAGAAGAGGKKWTKNGWMQSRSSSTCVFFSTGNTGVIGQGTAPVFSPDDVSVLRAFFTGLGKGEDPMEGGRGVLPPHRRNTVGRFFLYLLRSKSSLR